LPPRRRSGRRHCWGLSLGRHHSAVANWWNSDSRCIARRPRRGRTDGKKAATRLRLDPPRASPSEARLGALARAEQQCDQRETEQDRGWSEDDRITQLGGQGRDGRGNDRAAPQGNRPVWMLRAMGWRGVGRLHPRIRPLSPTACFGGPRDRAELRRATDTNVPEPAFGCGDCIELDELRTLTVCSPYRPLAVESARARLTLEHHCSDLCVARSAAVVASCTGVPRRRRAGASLGGFFRSVPSGLLAQRRRQCQASVKRTSRRS